MSMNDHTTGETSTCTVCGQAIEHGLLLKGFRGSPGIPVWRRPDRGPSCIVCPTSADTRHHPGTIRRGLPT